MFTTKIPMAINGGEPVEVMLPHKVVKPGKRFMVTRGNTLDTYCQTHVQSYWKVLYLSRWRIVFTGSPMFFMVGDERVFVEQTFSNDYMPRYIMNQIKNINSDFGWHY